MNLRDDVVVPIALAGFYFTGTYFLIAALITTTSAVIMASVVTILALLALLQLRRAGMATHGAPIIFLAVVFPFAIMLCAVGAWIVRFFVG